MAGKELHKVYVYNLGLLSGNPTPTLSQLAISHLRSQRAADPSKRVVQLGKNCN